MNNQEVFNNLCDKCRKECKKTGIIDSYCRRCEQSLFKLYKIERQNKY